MGQSQDKILYTGWFDFSEPSTPVFSHVSSSIKATFRGTEISGTSSSAGRTSYLYVIIDGNTIMRSDFYTKVIKFPKKYHRESIPRKYTAHHIPE